MEATAPEWATRVQARMLFVACGGEAAGCFGGGTVFWDDLSFAQLPPPLVPFGSAASVASLLGALIAVGVGHARRSTPRVSS